MNIFDGMIVSLSIFEILFLSGGSKAVSAFRAVRIFRTFRVLRVTRLLRGLEFMGKIVKVINKTLDSFVYIALLLFLFIFIFSLLGM
jgi:Ion transport protein